jgi:hypothetical protein
VTHWKGSANNRFWLFMVKAVLSGRGDGDEIVDLAKVNLFR